MFATNIMLPCDSSKSKTKDNCTTRMTVRFHLAKEEVHKTLVSKKNLKCSVCGKGIPFRYTHKKYLE